MTYSPVGGLSGVQLGPSIERGQHSIDKKLAGHYESRPEVMDLQQKVLASGKSVASAEHIPSVRVLLQAIQPADLRVVSSPLDVTIQCAYFLFVSSGRAWSIALSSGSASALVVKTTLECMDRYRSDGCLFRSMKKMGKEME